MAEVNPMIIGTLILLGGLLVLPFGNDYVKLFLIAVGTLLIATGAVQAVRRRREKPGGRSDRPGRNPGVKPKKRQWTRNLIILLYPVSLFEVEPWL
jgi:hypothetical protein